MYAVKILKCIYMVTNDTKLKIFYSIPSPNTHSYASRLSEKFAESASTMMVEVIEYKSIKELKGNTFESFETKGLQ